MAALRDVLLRRVLHTYWRLQRGMTLGVRGVVFDRDRRVFLILHTYVPGWQFPGGGVEVGETVLDALERELKEEGNISLAGPPRLHGLFLQRSVSMRAHVAVFVAEAFEQPALPAPNREIAACGWFKPDALPEDTTPGTRRRIAEVAAGTPAPAVW